MLNCRSAWQSAALSLTVALFSTAKAAQPGLAAPTFDLPSTTPGQQIKLAELKGQVVYVDFWASWCGPCRKSFPWMNAMQSKYGAQGFKIVAINLDTERKLAQQFLSETPAKFAVAFDANAQSPKQYKIKGMPSSVLVGRDGKVIAVHSGFNAQSAKDLEQLIAVAVKDSSGN
jgi:cytochrome c biogenesis protein CcmG, thiol:disulfide interchange protein DsbE